MIFQPRRRERLQVQAPLTSLIDMVFMLLIYFLLTANFMVDEGISIKLPQARAGTPQNERLVTVNIDREGRIFIGSRECVEGTLLHHLKEILVGRRNKLVVVKADRGVMLDKAVKVLDLAKAAGAERLSLATEKYP